MSEQVVVVVEDDPLQRSHAVAVLDAAGLSVADFETADEALVFLENCGCDVAAVLTDVQLPGTLDGFDLALKISISWPKTLVLMTSGMERPSSLLIPSIVFLPKPWQDVDVLAAIGTATADRAGGGLRRA